MGVVVMMIMMMTMMTVAVTERDHMLLEFKRNNN